MEIIILWNANSLFYPTGMHAVHTLACACHSHGRVQLAILLQECGGYVQWQESHYWRSFIQQNLCFVKLLMSCTVKCGTNATIIIYF